MQIVCMYSSFVIGTKQLSYSILYVIIVLPNTTKTYCDQKHLQTLITS